MADLSCVICGTPGATLCSDVCLEAATREQERNAALLRQLAGDPAQSARRREIAHRNGDLSSALISWRPQPAGSDGI